MKQKTLKFFFSLCRHINYTKRICKMDRYSNDISFSDDSPVRYRKKNTSSSSAWLWWLVILFVLMMFIYNWYPVAPINVYNSVYKFVVGKEDDCPTSESM